MSANKKLIEAGWLELKVRFETILSDYQLDMMRMAYMAGAVQAYSLCILTIPKESLADKKEMSRIAQAQQARLAAICNELTDFREALDDDARKHVH